MIVVGKTVKGWWPAAVDGQIPGTKRKKKKDSMLGWGTQRKNSTRIGLRVTFCRRQPLTLYDPVCRYFKIWRFYPWRTVGLLDRN
jgi:hypothetical protein